jgi:capsular polysaccharide biosynthesis protein
MGSSNVFRLSVTDREPHVAAALANRLAQSVTDTWDRQQSDSANKLASDLDSQMNALRQQIDTIDRSLSAPSNVNGGSAANTLLARRADLSHQLTDLADQRSHVVADDTLRAKPWVLQAAVPPTSPQPSGLAQDVVLGALLGLLTGIGIAAVVETLRPRLLGARAQAVVLDVPVLGEYTVHGSTLTHDELQTLSRRFALAAHAHQLSAVALFDLARRDRHRLDSTSLAGALVDGSSPSGEPAIDLTEEEEVPASRFDLLVARPSHWSPRARTEQAPNVTRQVTRHRLRVLPFDAASAEQVRVPTGFVVITPPGLPTREIDRIEDVRRTTGWPLLGVVCVRATRWVALRDRCAGIRPRRLARVRERGHQPEREHGLDGEHEHDHDFATTVAGRRA